MDITALHNRLFPLTENEKHHLLHPGKPSDRYYRIEKTVINEEEIYLFCFNTLLKERNICMHKESRFIAIPKHVHTVIELNYVYSGECTQIINGKKVHLQQGDLCLLDMNTIHEMLPLSENDIVISIEMRKTYFMDGFLSRLSSQGLVSRFLVNALSENHHQQQYLIFRHTCDSSVHHVIQQLLCEYFDFRICSNEMMDAYMIILFSELLRNYQQHNLGNPDDEHDELALHVLKYIESHYRTVSLASMSEHFGFHPNYLSALIKKKLGKTYKELIITQRMLQAAFYLKHSNTPITEIAHEVGYKNMGFFYQKFLENYNKTPAEFRQHSIDKS